MESLRQQPLLEAGHGQDCPPAKEGEIQQKFGGKSTISISHLKDRTWYVSNPNLFFRDFPHTWRLGEQPPGLDRPCHPTMPRAIISQGLMESEQDQLTSPAFYLHTLTIKRLLK